MKRIIPFLFVVSVNFFVRGLQAEEYPDWKGFPPMYTIQDMIDFNGALYCACKGGLYKYDTLTQEYTLYYKNHGLLSNDVLSIGATSEAIFLGFKEYGLVRFDPETEDYEQILFTEYTASNPPIAVYSIFAYNDSILYIGHSKGVDKINIFTRELRTFTNLGEDIADETPVNEVKIIKGRIWACTDLGLAYADFDNPDLELQENWKNLTFSQSRYTCIERIVDSSEDRIYLGSKWNGIQIYNEEADKIEPSAITQGGVYEITQTSGFGWAGGDRGLYRKYVKSWFRYDSEYNRIKAVLGSSGDNLWVGTENAGLQYYTQEKYQPIPPVSGPRHSKFTNIEISGDNVLWVTTAYRDLDADALVLRYDNGIWTEYGEEEDMYVDHSSVDVVVDDTGLVWIPTWGKGLYVLTDDGTPDKENDTVERVDPDGLIVKPTIKNWYFVCTAVTKDEYGNIWVANHQVEDLADSGPIVIDGYPINRHETYSPLEDGLATAEILNIETDKDGWVWLSTGDDGLIALFVGEDPFDKSDTYVRNLNLDDGLHGMLITAMKYDLDGDVWVGTKGGLNRIKKLSNKQLKIDDMNMLLEGVAAEISCIEVYVYKKKWIGTMGAGLYKIDSNNEAAGRFTIDNSGLFSDTIFSLKYDNDGDILWIGTDTGLNQYFVFGTTEEEKKTAIHVYPNPFEIWGSNSLVTFTNLEPGSSVRIFNFTGELVNVLVAGEMKPNSGASVSWNGLNFKLETVSSGIYFYTGTDTNGRHFKDKMVVIRR